MHVPLLHPFPYCQSQLLGQLSSLHCLVYLCESSHWLQQNFSSFWTETISWGCLLTCSTTLNTWDSGGWRGPQENLQWKEVTSAMSGLLERKPRPSYVPKLLLASTPRHTQSWGLPHCAFAVPEAHLTFTSHLCSLAQIRGEATLPSSLDLPLLFCFPVSSQLITILISHRATLLWCKVWYSCMFLECFAQIS